MSYQSNFARRGDTGGQTHRPSPASAPHETGSGRYTFTLGRHQWRLRPIAFWGFAGLLTVMTVWSAATASYFAFREQFLSGLVARQAAMQYAYEDRITRMKGEVDRLNAKQLLDQEQFEYKLDQIVRRQATLESRAAALSGMPDADKSAKAPPAAAMPPAAPAPESAPAPTKPSPISDTPAAAPPAGRGAWLQPWPTRPAAVRDSVARKAITLDTALRDLQASLDRVEAHQAVTLNGLAETYDTKARRMRGVLVELGMDPAKVPNSAVGGPFVPVPPPQPNASGFEHQLHRINVARLALERLNQALITVPIRKPIPGVLETTSTFGVRLDPFVRAPAMHTGVDLRGNIGDPVYATAAGTVTQAGWNSGYGKMVEIDHGNGFSTRYGHLSAIDVTEGQTIRIGQVVGRIGMTGRTTGPHLHYETRVDGDAVDPQKFLRAERRLRGTL